jgi:hypothetical protein
MNKARSFIFYGALGGMWGVKGRLDEYASKLLKYGPVTTHYSTDNSPIGIANNQSLPVVLWGFSLGANQTDYVAGFIRNDLPIIAVVAMDPSRQSPLCRGGQHVVSSRVEAALCFWNPGALVYGGCRFLGKHVTERRINKFHLAVPYDRQLLDEAYHFIQKQIAEEVVA